jgi:hypothetical protein
MKDAMSRLKSNKKIRTRRRKNEKSDAQLDSLRAGMPAKDSITGVDTFKRGGKVFQVIHTNEIDAYDEKPSKTKRRKG